MKIKAGSFIDQLYTLNDYRPQKTDVCSYVRGVLGGAFMAISLVALGVFFGVVALEPIFIAIMYVITGHLDGFYGGSATDPLLLAVVSTMFYALAILIYGSHLIKMAYQEIRGVGNGYNKEPTVVGTYIKSIKEKTCFLVERV